MKLPLSAPSLGISDTATAAAALINLEFSREGVAFNDCTLAFHADDDDAEEAPEHFKFRLHVKSHGKKEVKGSCTNGVPAVQDGDVVTGYGLVGEVRVPFLGN